MAMTNGRHPFDPELMEERRRKDHEMIQRAFMQGCKVQVIKHDPCGSYEINGGKTEMRDKYLVILAKNEDGTDYIYDSGKMTSIDLYGKKGFDEIFDFQNVDDVANYDKLRNLTIVLHLLACVKAERYLDDLMVVWVDNDTDKALFGVFYKHKPDYTAEVEWGDWPEGRFFYKEDEGFKDSMNSEDIKKRNSEIEEELKEMRQLLEEMQLKLSEMERSYE